MPSHKLKPLAAIFGLRTPRCVPRRWRSSFVILLLQADVLIASWRAKLLHSFPQAAPRAGARQRGRPPACLITLSSALAHVRSRQAHTPETGMVRLASGGRQVRILHVCRRLMRAPHPPAGIITCPARQPAPYAGEISLLPRRSGALRTLPPARLWSGAGLGPHWVAWPSRVRKDFRREIIGFRPYGSLR
jgi:hypothetical protein